MKIVILDGYAENPGDLDWKGFEALGETVVYDRTPFEPDEIVRRIGQAEIVITNKTPLSAETIAACPQIQYIGLLSTGYNVVDVAAAAGRRIPVCNIPSYGTATVAQFTLALILELTSRVGHHDQAVHAGRWTQCPDFCFWDFPLMELSGLTLGIVGFGRIGQAVARVARSLGMRVIAAGSRPTEQGRALAEYVSLDDLYAQADIISLHCPITGQNKGMINGASLARMKPGVLFINTARGGLVNEADLAEALHRGHVAGAAVDVVSVEPIRADNPLLGAPNCIITPHIAWATKAARTRLMSTAVGNLRAFLAGKPENVVNL